MTFRFIDVEKHNHKVAQLCRVLRVSRSGYYAWASRGLSDHAASDIALAAEVTRFTRIGWHVRCSAGSRGTCATGVA